MNVENLKLMSDFIKDIDPKLFDIRTSRMDTSYGVVRNAIAHCAIHFMESNPEADIEEPHTYYKWAKDFTGLSLYSLEWKWCFSANWSHSRNNPIDTSQRINYLLAFGLPRDWFSQMNGLTEVIYNKICL